VTNVPGVTPRRPADALSATLVERLSAERDRLEALLLRLPAIHAEVDAERLVEQLSEAAREVMDADFCMYVGVTGDAPLHVVATARDVTFEDVPAPSLAPLLAASFTGGPPLRVDDTTRWALSEDATRPYGSLKGGQVIRSYLAAAVTARSGGVIGAVFLGHHQARAFDDRDERLIDAMAAHLAVALDKAELLAERAQVATVLQETLLPPLLPVVPHVDSGARYRPTGSGNLVGGDFYDFFPTGPNEWGVVIGDVSGVGPEAAALTGIARYTIRAVADDEGPSGILRALNDALNNQRTGDRFCSAVYLRLEPSPEGVDVTLANAGHPPALLLRDDGRVEVVDGETGMLLGLFPDAEIVERPLRLLPGDAIVLYTDGVIEARDPATGEFFGQERLEALVSQCAGRTADGIARRVELAVIDHQAGQTLDDVAVLVVRSLPDSLAEAAGELRR
jgi:serine phosphatase RsbU (regulator of sigma subunit)